MNASASQGFPWQIKPLVPHELSASGALRQSCLQHLFFQPLHVLRGHHDPDFPSHVQMLEGMQVEVLGATGKRRAKRRCRLKTKEECRPGISFAAEGACPLDIQ